MKRVGCLYRVSTKKQVYENDIPVQKTACRDFIDKKIDWILEKEYIELGVSGYKLSSTKRDILQEIKNDVLNNKIDILLVFMFDRIGRKDDETPFVVEWLIKNGIEVWSVNEGQRKIEDRYDKLINYVTYWQAEGESEKISVRATERRIQLTKEGVYLGNYAPYGYEMVDSDIYTKIGKIRRILKIYPDEANVITKIFDLIVDSNYGTDKIAIELNKEGIKRRKENLKWDCNVILEIIRNPIYKGYVSFGKRNKKGTNNKRIERSKWILADKTNEDIIIISEERWNLANKIIDERSRKGERVFRLLSGLTRCGYCKSHVVPKGKTKYTYMRCKGKQRTGDCEYTKYYRVDRLEAIIEKEIMNYLKTLRKYDMKDLIAKKIKESNKAEEQLKKISKQTERAKLKIEELKADVMETLLSGNQEQQDKISNDLNEQNEIMNNLNLQKSILEKEIKKINNDINNLSQCIPSWEKEFKRAKLETKRIIINEIIDKIYLYNDKIEIQIKYPIEKFIIKVGNNE